MSRHGKAPSMKNPRPVPTDIITLGRCIHCKALLTGPRPGPRVTKVYIVCPRCEFAQLIARQLIE